ncbi:hypothetical protein GWK47_009284 [Chionoecetes opilio]|uniref:Sacsin/Nov domain-containing protein n=1 Tax=Chionoecetes opilio TaxID=41210 RepID=A0A8J4XYN5_CHIOP|nr:hypothetical protein GWK47_009284 [Chionoecetes opilio]
MATTITITRLTAGATAKYSGLETFSSSPTTHASLTHHPRQPPPSPTTATKPPTTHDSLQPHPPPTKPPASPTTHDSLQPHPPPTTAASLTHHPRQPPASPTTHDSPPASPTPHDSHQTSPPHPRQPPASPPTHDSLQPHPPPTTATSLTHHPRQPPASPTTPGQPPASPTTHDSLQPHPPPTTAASLTTTPDSPPPSPTPTTAASPPTTHGQPPASPTTHDSRQPHHHPRQPPASPTTHDSLQPHHHPPPTTASSLTHHPKTAAQPHPPPTTASTLTHHPRQPPASPTTHDSLHLTPHPRQPPASPTTPHSLQPHPPPTTASTSPTTHDSHPPHPHPRSRQPHPPPPTAASPTHHHDSHQPHPPPRQPPRLTTTASTLTHDSRQPHPLTHDSRQPHPNPPRQPPPSPTPHDSLHPHPPPTTASTLTHHPRQPPASPTNPRQPTLTHHPRQPNRLTHPTTASSLTHHPRQLHPHPPPTTATSLTHHPRQPPPSPTTHDSLHPHPPPTTASTLTHHPRQPPASPTTHNSLQPHPPPTIASSLTHHPRQPPASPTTHDSRQPHPPPTTAASLTHHPRQPPASPTTHDSRQPHPPPPPEKHFKCGRGDPFTYNTIEVPTVVGLMRNILTQYPDNGQIIKELVQNAEDAGATKVALVHVPCDLQYPEADQVVQRFLQVINMTTRAASNLWLINKAPIDEITGARLPSKEQVLLRYYHHHREMGKTASGSRKAVVEEVLPFWSRAGIPTTTVIHAGTKLSKMVKAYNDLKKNKNKDRPKHRMDEEIFKGDLQEIFDLAHSSSLQWADVKDEDKEFLRSQREDRGESSMAGIDLVTAKKVEKQVERGTRIKRLREREDSDIARLTERAEIPSQSSSSSSSPVPMTSSPAREDDAEFLLGVPASSDSTGRNVAALVLKEVDEAGVRDKIIAFCFDTTASNTGMVQASLGSSSGPDIGIFKRLRDRWSFVDSSQRETVETSKDLVEFFATNDTASKLKDDALTFLKEALMSKNHPREDYEELLRLSYLFLGAALTGREKAGVERVALFVALVYCKQWHEAPISVKAPLNDVLFLEILKTYPDQTVAKAAEQALRRHLWYVSEENAGLAFFDSRIDVEEKKQMVKALDKPASKKELKQLEGTKMTMSSSLSSFVTSKTRSFFQKLDADEGFLAKDPALWEENDRFKDARKRALGLRVVNDAAERGIALVQRYLGSTKSAAQEKYLLQLIHHHRKLVGREKKEDLQKKAF